MESSPQKEPAPQPAPQEAVHPCKYTGQAKVTTPAHGLASAAVYTQGGKQIKKSKQKPQEVVLSVSGEGLIASTPTTTTWATELVLLHVGLDQTFSIVRKKGALMVLVRCAYSDRKVHSRMPMDPMHGRFKRTFV
jgi:hypothetical protein